MAKKAKKSQFHQPLAVFQRMAARHTNPLKGVSRKTYPTKPPKVG